MIVLSVMGFIRYPQCLRESRAHAEYAAIARLAHDFVVFQKLLFTDRAVTFALRLAEHDIIHAVAFKERLHDVYPQVLVDLRHVNRA